MVRFHNGVRVFMFVVLPALSMRLKPASICRGLGDIRLPSCGQARDDRNTLLSACRPRELSGPPAAPKAPPRVRECYAYLHTRQLPLEAARPTWSHREAA